MTGRRIVLALLASALSIVAVPVATASADAAAPEGIPAKVTSISFSGSTETWQTVDFADPTQPAVGTTTWHVVKDTGNCCENYLATTQGGWLIDAGGTYINYSEDGGAHWKRVAPQEPLVGGEGAVTVAPNGDVVAVLWDVYSGDHLMAVKFDAATEQWSYVEQPLHAPFFDREWVGIVPGPITIGAVTVPYVTLLRGGFPSKDIWYYSLNGLTYELLGSRSLDETVNGDAAPSALAPAVDAAADWDQPDTGSLMTPIGNGALLAAPENYTQPTSEWQTFDATTMRWTGYTPSDSATSSDARILADSRGWLHRFTPEGGAFGYGVSTDGGKTWSSIDEPLPCNCSIDTSDVQDYDFKVNGALGIAAIVMHVKDATTGTSRDLVYKIDVSTPQPRVARRYVVGKGDLTTGVGLGSSAPRFDFDTIAILPDGRVAVSFDDSTHTTPAVAIEQTTTLPTPSPSPSPS